LKNDRSRFHGIIANRQRVLYVGWSVYTGIIIKIIIEHTKVNIKKYKLPNI